MQLRLFDIFKFILLYFFCNKKYLFVIGYVNKIIVKTDYAVATL